MILSSQTVSLFNPSTLFIGNSTPNLSYRTTQLCYKPGVVGDLSDSLRDIGLTKSNYKLLYNARIQETQWRKIIE